MRPAADVLAMSDRPPTNDMIYFDYNASAPVASESVDAVYDYLDSGYGNPSSKHGAGELAKRAMQEARVQVASLLNAHPAEIVFTAGGTEGNHAAVLGALAMAPEKNHIVTSTVEHPSLLLLFKHLETRGVRVTYLEVDAAGRLDPSQIEEAICKETALVSLMWANNETGVVFPIAEVARRVKARGVLFHSDAVQAAGKLALDVATAPVDLLTLSGHKLYAPSGVGVLYMRKGLKLPPLLYGHQERGRRGGTENVSGIIGLGIAALLVRDGLCTEMPQMAALRQRLETGVLERFPFASINGANGERLANTSNIRFGDLNGEAIVQKLDQAGVCVSQGAACSAGGTEPSHVLTAMGLSPEAAQASIRFSLGRYNTLEEVDRVLDLLSTIIASGVADAA
jgi:cysteine desulfurase